MIHSLASWQVVPQFSSSDFIWTLLSSTMCKFQLFSFLSNVSIFRHSVLLSTLSAWRYHFYLPMHFPGNYFALTTSSGLWSKSFIPFCNMHTSSLVSELPEGTFFFHYLSGDLGPIFKLCMNTHVSCFLIRNFTWPHLKNGCGTYLWKHPSHYVGTIPGVRSHRKVNCNQYRKRCVCQHG